MVSIPEHVTQLIAVLAAGIVGAVIGSLCRSPGSDQAASYVGFLFGALAAVIAFIVWRTQL